MTLRRAFVALSLIVAGALAAVGAGQAPAVPGGAPNAAQAARIAADAFTYGFPLMEFERVRAESANTPCSGHRGDSTINMLASSDHFMKPEAHIVVAPNVDTLYSMANIDLSKGPVVLSHPDMGDRYFSFQLMDPYTNVAAYIGSRTTGSAAGRYAISWSGNPGDLPGATTITVDHARIWLIGRTLAGDEADQRAALEKMTQYSLTPPGGGPRSTTCDFESVTPIDQPDGIAWLDALSTAMGNNPPPKRDAAQVKELARIGVGPGLRVSRAGLSPAAEAAVDQAVRAASAALPEIARTKQQTSALSHRGWGTAPDNTGDYGTDYLTRAGVAEIGLGANTPEEAAYNPAFSSADLLPLDGRLSSYRLHFAAGQEPPVDAFWSITAYDGDGYLVPNTENRHSVSNSRPDLIRRPDGSIDIVFSRSRPTDPSVNWLPIPDGPFRVYLRTYAPRASVLDHTWNPPGIQRF
ncbi:DUF1254 domain-containing protein [Gordonia sp. PKS22-38]|uniref:DUF1254 domain-containing protein n=1 Tax=Gordonia prachuapensis TaxID=3115651 RepID=A0ABU7MY42_9ACTN|nr:DUF1254 domain-containing protein [Gordonia sp. PKS22-38]